jgi:hypothetical protein
MARRGQHSFLKRQKEIKRKQKALEKMARRQGKKEQNGDVDKQQTKESQEEEEQELTRTQRTFSGGEICRKEGDLNSMVINFYICWRQA